MATKKIKKKEELNKIKAILVGNNVILGQEGMPLYTRSCFGSIVNKNIQLSLIEALYLLEKEKIDVYERKKKLSFEEFVRKSQRREKNFWIRYCIFKDLRNRGYIVKTALKFGADFRVYNRGIKPGQDHARWIVYPVNEASSITWFEFAAKNRVAHSTKKRLLIGVVDNENDVTYYEIRWVKP